MSYKEGYHRESTDSQKQLEKEFLNSPYYHGDDKKKHDYDHHDKKVIVKKYYKDDDDNDNDDVKELSAYNMGL